MKEEIKVDGICLRSVEYGENDRIITLLTDKSGKVSVRARGISSPKSRLRQATIPFAFGEYILVENGDFYTLKNFDYHDAFTAVSDDLTRYFCACAALEIADSSRVILIASTRLRALDVGAGSTLDLNGYTNAVATARAGGVNVPAGKYAADSTFPIGAGTLGDYLLDSASGGGGLLWVKGVGTLLIVK